MPLLLLAACGDEDPTAESSLEGGFASDTGSDASGNGQASDTASRPIDEPDPGHSDAGAREDASGSPDSGPSEDVGADAAADTSVDADGGADVGEELPEIIENDWVETSEDNLATFSIDVDTASYTLARDQILAGSLPDPYTVRTEEFINFFDYGYEAPKYGDEAPFAIHMEAAPSYFGDDNELLRVAIQAAVVDPEDRLGANLVLLVDVSGSMSSEMPLLQDSLRELLGQLHDTDTVSIVTYASSPSTALEPTAVSETSAILAAIEGLSSGGSTGGEGGIRAAYDLAEEAFVPEGVNRVVLCTDGDFNVGATGEALWDMIASFRSRDIYLTGLLFRASTFGDTQMEFLTNLGNGNYYTIGDRLAAVELFGDNFVGLLQVVAKDVKIQVELNPDVVARYRIVGYDNRVLEDWEFEDDTVDAGEVGAGQNVTAFLELELHPDAEGLPLDTILAGVDVRYKPMGSETSVLIENTVILNAMAADFESASDGFRWAAGVTEFAEILKESMHTEGERFDEIVAILEGLTDGIIRRTEFVGVVGAAQALWP